MVETKQLHAIPWEYKRVHVLADGGLEGRLNDLGKHGWELVASHWHASGYVSLVFKRPKA